MADFRSVFLFRESPTREGFGTAIREYYLKHKKTPDNSHAKKEATGSKDSEKTAKGEGELITKTSGENNKVSNQTKLVFQTKFSLQSSSFHYNQWSIVF